MLLLFQSSIVADMPITVCSPVKSDLTDTRPSLIRQDSASSSLMSNSEVGYIWGGGGGGGRS